MKKCARCKNEYNENRFREHKVKGITYLNSYCKNCENAYQHERYHLKKRKKQIASFHEGWKLRKELKNG